MRALSSEAVFYCNMEDKHTVTVDSAREILGKNEKAITDKQIQDLLELLRIICDKTIDSAIENDYAR